jgi:hypothetical protein
LKEDSYGIFGLRQNGRLTIKYIDYYLPMARGNKG